MFSCDWLNGINGNIFFPTTLYFISFMQGGCDDKYDDEVADTPRCRDYTYVCTDEKVDTCKAQNGVDPINNYMSCEYLQSNFYGNTS